MSKNVRTLEHQFRDKQSFSRMFFVLKVEIAFFVKDIYYSVVAKREHLYVSIKQSLYFHNQYDFSLEYNSEILNH